MRRTRAPAGRVETFDLRSDLLDGNPLGDDPTRRIAVYLPAGYGKDRARRYPVLFDLVGYTGSGLKHIAWQGFTENVPERLDRLIGEGAMAPAIAVFPDCFTALGGNQYIDSSAIGPWMGFIVRELVPAIDRLFATFGDRDHRGVFGKSSGGYGALVHGMRHADVWGAVACHSADLYFPYAYLPDMPLLLDVLAEHGRSVEGFLAALRGRQKHSGREIHALMMVAMAASYDPDTAAPLGFRLPVDLESGELIPERWARWLAHDPVEMAAGCADALRSLRCLHIDCGTRDEYRLHHGARILHRRLEALGVPHIHEEFDDDHSSIDYRLDVSLPRLVAALSD
jgi:S-formylglutathione hydrolase FrmB